MKFRLRRLIQDPAMLFLKRWHPWLMAGFIASLAALQAIYNLLILARLIDFVILPLFILGVSLIAFIGALIIVRHRGNRVGWLMIAVALVTAMQFFYDPLVVVSITPAPPSVLTPGLWLLLWINNWYGQLQIILIFQIVLYFPTGHPPSSRWNWLNTFAWGILFIAAMAVMFRDQIGPLNGAWTVDNPLGIFPPSVLPGSSQLSIIGLIIFGGGCVASLYIRFKQGGAVTRAQIKWLLFAGVEIIAVVMIYIVYISLNPDVTELPYWLSVLINISYLVLSLAIGNAILRYRLYDIDIIIRRTLQYTLLVGLLALMYFGGIVIFQRLLTPLTGNFNSPIITVITTLSIATLFNPLRVRVQNFIDRRFFRKKYDAEKALTEFAITIRDEVDVERLADVLLGLVAETMQPAQISLWLKDDPEKREPT